MPYASSIPATLGTYRRFKLNVFAIGLSERFTETLLGSSIRESAYGTLTVNCPGVTTEMIPPKLHIHLDVLLSAGKLLMSTVGEPGAQGAAVAGIQGMGVRTPNAAAVALATVGFAKDMHIAKVGILAMGA